LRSWVLPSDCNPLWKF